MSADDAVEAIERAARILREGGLVAFPTETVYGLGADASNDQAVARVFAAKGRPSGHPLIVHIAAAEQMGHWARDIPPAAWCLAKAFWPGPLTLILKRLPGVGEAAAGGQDTIGLRVPSHPMAQALLEVFGRGIAAPSANRFGRISPTQAAHVLADFRLKGEPVLVGTEALAEIDAVLDGGASDVGIESTIVDLTRGLPVILRPGRVAGELVRRALADAGIEPDDDVAGLGDAPAAPGTLASHYAPRAAMKLIGRQEFASEITRHRGQRVAVLALEVSVPRVPASVTRILPASAMLYARGLYASLRELDALGADLILVETPPLGGHWPAVHDRLNRAAHEHASGSRAERHASAWKGRKPVTAAGPVAASADAGEAAGLMSTDPADETDLVAVPDSVDGTVSPQDMPGKRGARAT